MLRVIWKGRIFLVCESRNRQNAREFGKFKSTTIFVIDRGRFSTELNRILHSIFSRESIVPLSWLVPSRKRKNFEKQLMERRARRALYSNYRTRNISRWRDNDSGGCIARGCKDVWDACENRHMLSVGSITVLFFPMLGFDTDRNRGIKEFIHFNLRNNTVINISRSDFKQIII